ncbi:MAG: cyclic pyranopterin monophosphate synthase MoaC [Spirochaetales bacterium]|uniref:Cyclic pyranopterin monophosphate synthase n=1 Tax=Candidatus Thalassospirochaeta sargassi TaxID=3119039 RepID=A0AAJ1IDU6_9SPIO|nr:cyclic pyranopterin monophosphate synthase MoaC [Spirochaetales bacterium]
MKLSHVDASGKARMVDVSGKDDTVRTAVARGQVKMAADTLKTITDNNNKKGDVLQTARIAGIMAAKKVPDLIPLCHTIAVTGVRVDITADDGLPGVLIEAEVRSSGKTGVEMEALQAVSVAALTVYDMCKAVEKTMVIDNIRLVKKNGGKSGDVNLEE